MTPRRTRSTRRSATRSRPKAVTLLIDECLGRVAIPAALRATGATVVLHHEWFKPGTADEVWLRELRARTHVAVLTKDKQIRKRTIEHDAVVTGRVRLFTLTAAGLSGQDQALSLVRALPKILRLCQQPGPFIATVTQSGIVKLLVDDRRTARRRERAASKRK